ncbi:MAG: DUF2062 domain-containing protein [Nitrospirae bacterium]|nr:MAG: DUF2062 domain-containing protein [Nitrospirota bacterium]
MSTLSIRDNIRYIFTIKGSPRSIAAAFALGVFIGLSPFIGLHTLLALVLSSLLGLNRMVTLSGAYLTNPWTIVPIYTFCTWFGIKITGYEQSMPDIDFHSINILNLFRALKSLLWPFFVGTTLVGVVCALISYLIVYRLLLRIKG